MPARIAADSDSPWFETRLRVRYAETDKMGVVYHANFVVWLEVGRTDLCKQCGFSYRDMEIEEDAHLMVTDVSIRYRRPARYDDEILIRTRVAEMAKRTLKFEYLVLNAVTGDTLAEGATSHVVTSSAGRPRSFPAAQAALVAARLYALRAAVTLNDQEEEHE
jgi:acyl-CoA thioester hydrolase